MLKDSKIEIKEPEEKTKAPSHWVQAEDFTVEISVQRKIREERRKLLQGGVKASLERAHATEAEGHHQIAQEIALSVSHALEHGQQEDETKLTSSRINFDDFCKLLLLEEKNPDKISLPDSLYQELNIDEKIQPYFFIHTTTEVTKENIHTFFQEGEQGYILYSYNGDSYLHYYNPAKKIIILDEERLGHERTQTAIVLKQRMGSHLSERNKKILIPYSCLSGFRRLVPNNEPQAQPFDTLKKWWNNLLGHIDIPRANFPGCSTDDDSYLRYQRPQNQIASFFTLNSIRKIIANHKKFQSGIDLQHLKGTGWIVRAQTLDFIPELSDLNDRSIDAKIAVRLNPLKQKQSSETKSVINVESKEPEEKTPLPVLPPHSQASEPWRNWWNYLYQQNQLAGSDDELVDLAHAFATFKNYLQTYNLKLPELPTGGFSYPPKNLPTTLGRIISIIENCAEENRQQQLNFIPHLDLSSTGAIRALDKRTDKVRCRFIHPAMNCQASAFDNQGYVVSGWFPYNTNYFSPHWIYNAYYLYKRMAQAHQDSKFSAADINISKAGAEPLMAEIFWRYIAHRDSLPLDFYLGNHKNPGALAKIKEFKDPEIQAYLYYCLASVSTGLALMYGHDSDEIQKMWEHLCDTVKKIYQLDLLNNGWAIAFLKQLSSLPLLPPPFLFEQILVLSENCHSIHFGREKDIESLHQAFNKLKVVQEYLRNNEFYHIPYRGMRFYVDRTKQAESKSKDKFEKFTNPQKSIFYNYIDIFDTMRKLGGMYHGEEAHFARAHARFLIQAYDSFDFENAHQFTEEKEVKNLIAQQKQQNHWLLKDNESLILLKDNESLIVLKLINDKIYTIFSFTRRGVAFELKDYFFGLLNQINNRQSLNIGSLNLLLDKIDELLKPFDQQRNRVEDRNTVIIQFIEFLQVHYPQNFPQDFLARELIRYRQSFLDERIQNAIKIFPLEQQDLIKKLIIFHNAELSTDGSKALAIIEKLETLLLMFGADDEILTNCLQGLVEYQKANPINHDEKHSVRAVHTLADLDKLFDAIIRVNNPLLLESLLYQPSFTKIPNLVQKTSVFYETIAPWLQANHQQIPQQHAYSAICDVFMSAPYSEFKNPIKRELQISSLTLEDRLIDQLSSQLAAIKDNPSKEQAQWLLDTVVELLKKPEGFNEEMLVTLWQAYHFLINQQEAPLPVLPPHSQARGGKGPAVKLAAFPEDVTETNFLSSSHSQARGGKGPVEVKTEVKENKKPENATQKQSIFSRMLRTVTQAFSSSQESQTETKESERKSSQPKETKSESSASQQQARQAFQEFLQKETPKEFKQISTDLYNRVVTPQKGYRLSYQRFLLNYYQHIYHIIHTHPAVKQDLLAFISQFAKKYQPTEEKIEDSKQNSLAYTSYAEALKNQLQYLECAAENLDQNELRNLLYYCRQNNDTNLVLNLIKIIEDGKFKFNELTKKTLYQFCAKLVGQQTEVKAADSKQVTKIPVLTINDFTSLCQLCSTQSVLAQQIISFYQHPPYLSLSEVIGWTQDSKQESKSVENKSSTSIQDKYNVFDREPFKRDANNDFNLIAAKAQAKKFSKNAGLSDAIVEELAEWIAHYKAMSTSEKITALLASLNEESKVEAKSSTSFETKSSRNSRIKKTTLTNVQLTALLGELLYSTTNQAFNDTQYLALYTGLATSQSVTHQIETSGGKSRIAMALCAGKFLQGKEVDVATSDMKLAERDYHRTRPFFQACEIPTQIVDVNTSSEQYQQRSIRFSDNQQLGLLHNKLKANGIKINKKNHVLVLDEADKAYCDPRILRLNYATREFKDLLKNMKWIYPLLMQFSERLNEAFTTSYGQEDIRIIYADFCNFVLQKHLPENKLIQFNLIKEKYPYYLEVWLHAAFIANGLKKGIDYNDQVAIDQPILTEYGLQIASKAAVIIENTVSLPSVFSDEVQQCLHARLNIERQKIRQKNLVIEQQNQEIRVNGGVPKQLTSTSKTSFYIESLSHIIFSSTIPTLLTHYEQVCGLTGSSGSKIERPEITKRHNMQFIDVPAHRESKRIDHCVHVTANAEQQKRWLKQYHEQARAQGQPALLLAKNDNESQDCMDEFKDWDSSIRRVDSTKNGYEETVEEAGNSRQLTISTDLFSRGVDIRLAEDVREKGLFVSMTDLSTTRKYIQMSGRAGRYGAPGDTRMILNLQNIKQQLALATDTPLDDKELIGLFLYRDSFIQQLQILLDKQEQDIRVVLTLLDQLLNQIQEHFFEVIGEQEASSKDDLKEKWIQFFGNLRKQIIVPQGDEIQQLLKQHGDHEATSETMVTKLNFVFTQCNNEYLKFLQTNQLSIANDLLARSLPANWEAQVHNQLKPLPSTAPRRQKTSDNFEPAHAGQNIVYHNLFAERRYAWNQWRKDEASFWEVLSPSYHQQAAAQGAGLNNPAQRAYQLGYRPLFANTQAWLQGDLNKEWDEFYKTCDQLEEIINESETKDASRVPMRKVAAQNVLVAVKNASPNAAKENLILLTQILKATTETLENPNETNVSNYAKLTQKIENTSYWQNVRSSMCILLGVLLIGFFAAITLLSHGFAAPISLWGIKMACGLIMTHIAAISGTLGMGLVAIGAYNNSNTRNKYLAGQMRVFTNQQAKPVEEEKAIFTDRTDIELASPMV